MLRFFISFIVIVQVFEIFGIFSHCQAIRLPRAPTDDQIQNSVSPHDDYEYTLGVGSHKIHRNAETWNRARIICKEEGGHLAVINSFAESQAIADLYRRSLPHIGSRDSNHIMIGYHDLFEEGDFVTVHGESLLEAGFNEWYHNEPNNNHGNEDCGAFVNGKLNDVPCHDPYAFVCERSEIPAYAVDGYDLYTVNLQYL